ncbi:rhodanese-like domain-containing protein [Desulfoglaeba alkanexedens]|uniref:Rhodanese-like domain-containing protein n=1 Tax=Desulfoglaeba alkanexedens ALDC TaxID=980445 RepID=A0A4P8L249_9BACT|nr:rhodanese-like domain-containing protein [Desulfoglaeba alkanexedens]QCQ20802.1 rhodanese-like domain-containing protein [Desulfoglaeba alkanexedens ALDC]
MKVKTLLTALIVFLAVGFSTAYGADPANGTLDLVAGEKKILAEFKKEIPIDRIINVEQFKKIVDEVNAGTREAYLLDLRSAPEFYTFHIEGADNIHAGHVYTIPRHIADANAEIYIYCRTSHRAFYVAHFLYDYGYTNIWLVDGGMLAWLKAGYPVVNQYMGKFVAKYENFDNDYSSDYRETGKYRVREFHPY